MWRVIKIQICKLFYFILLNIGFKSVGGYITEELNIISTTGCRTETGDYKNKNN
jgi:hypothetical protein